MERKRIVFLDEGRGVGGAEVQLLSVLGHLDKEAFDPLVVLSDKGKFYERLKELGVRTVLIKTPPFLSTSLVLRDRRIPNIFAIPYNTFLILYKTVMFWRYLLRSRADSVQTNALFEHIYGGLACRIAHIPCIWHMQDIVSDTFLLGAGKFFIDAAAAMIPLKIIAISQVTKKALSEKAQEKAVVVYNGVDTDTFSPRADKDSRAMKSRFGFRQDTPVVAITSRLVSWKGHKDFIRAAGIISQRMPEARFLIIGDTTFGGKGYRRELEDLAKETGLKERIVFTGFLDNIEQALAAADIVVHCPRRPEPFGLSIIEAMACQKAVVATDIGAPREIIQDGLNGRLVPPQDPKVLSDVILDLLQSESRRDSLGQSARACVEDTFSVKRLTSDLEKIYASFDKRPQADKKRKRKVLFVHQTWKGFEKCDYDILNRHFSVSDAPVYKNFVLETVSILRDIAKTDVVFCWFAYRLALAPLLIAKALRKKIIIVGSGWEAANMPEISFGAMRPGARFLINRLLIRWIINLADKVIAVSEFNRQELQTNVGLPRERIKLIFLGVETGDSIGGVGLSKNKNMVLTVGEVNRENMSRKGLAIFVETARLLPDKEFVLVGGRQERLKEYMQKPIPANLRVVPFSRGEAQKWYRQAKVYVQVSGHENFGLSLAEAMSYECVPVVTDRTALPEVVADAGYYVPYQDARKTAQTIRLAAEDTVKGLAARKRIEKLFPLRKREESLVSLIYTVMATEDSA
jgi:glycosyltransferase involved in cell wall biosynthesis